MAFRLDLEPMLIMEFFAFKNHLQKHHETLCYFHSPAEKFFYSLYDVFFYCAKNDVREYNRVLVEAIRLGAAHGVIKDIGKALDVGDYEDPQYPSAKKFYENFVEKFVIASAQQDKTPEIFRIGKSIKEILKKEMDKHFLPRASGYKTLEQDAGKLQQKLSDLHIRELVEKNCYQLNSQVINDLTEQQVDLIKHPCILQLLHTDNKIFEINELLRVFNRYKEFEAHKNIFASEDFISDMKKLIQTLDPADVKNLFVIVFSRTDLPLIHLAAAMSWCMSTAKTPSYELLIKLLQENLSWNDTLDKAQGLIAEAYQCKYPEPELAQTMEQFAGVQYPLDSQELSLMEEEYKAINDHKISLGMMGGHELKAKIADCNKALRKNIKNTEAKHLLLAMIREQFKRSCEQFPHNTQMLNVLALINDPHHRRIAQMGEGEDKTVIIAILSAYLCLACGEKVDIITSSDVGTFKAFYAKLGLTAVHNKEWRRSATYESNIVYGALSEFALTHLAEGSGSEKIREHQRPYAAVIVDEVDSMFYYSLQNNPTCLPLSNDANQTLALITHVDYFNKYPKIFGLTCGFSDLAEKSELEHLYQASFYHSSACGPHSVNASKLLCDDNEREFSEHKIQKRKVEFIRHLIQQLFFSLPHTYRDGLKRSWAECFTRLSAAVDKEHGVDQEAVGNLIAMVSDEVKKFWKSHVEDLLYMEDLVLYLKRLKDPRLLDLLVHKVMPDEVPTQQYDYVKNAGEIHSLIKSNENGNLNNVYFGRRGCRK